jgi:hypothetical protein
MSERARRWIGLYAAVAALIAVLLSPLLALSYFATEEGRAELETGTVAVWAEPGRELAGGLLTWASPDRVYATYWQVFALLIPAMFLCAHAARSRRSPRGRTERWGWRGALTGYALEKVGFLAVFVALLVFDVHSTVVDVIFLGFGIPGLLISAVGSTLLGIGLIRAAYRPRVTSWLLALAFPSIVVVPAFLGNLSLGLVPFLVAWGATGLRLWREGEPEGAQRALAADPA